MDEKPYSSDDLDRIEKGFRTGKPYAYNFGRLLETAKLAIKLTSTATST